MRLIRLEYDGGDWDLNFGIGGDLNMLIEYGILTQQKVAEKTESRADRPARQLSAGKSPPLVFMTGQGNLSLSNNDVKMLREYLLDKHGMLVRVNGGSQHFHNQFLAAMNRVLPDVRPVPVPLDDRFTACRSPCRSCPMSCRTAARTPSAGRWMAAGSSITIPATSATPGPTATRGVAPEIYNACYQLGTNVMFYGHAEYAKWLMAQAKKK